MPYQLGFWKTLQKPFFVLAPMSDVTDPSFRRIIAKYGKPDVMFTQFVSCDGLCSEGKKILRHDLLFSARERPIVVQFFGKNPDNFYTCAKLAQKLSFDGIDINMGCPDKNVIKQGAGAALIKNPELAKKIIRATKKGAGRLPVSVKTRIGDTTNILRTWLPELLAAKPAAITIHARTRKEMSKVPAHWASVAEAVNIAKETKTLIIGNGDAKNLNKAGQLADKTGSDGIMLGRAIFGNPWLFNKTIGIDTISLPEKLRVMTEHALLFEKLSGDIKNFDVMKKHLKSYASGFKDSKNFRIQLMKTKNAQQVKMAVKAFLNSQA